MKKYPGDKAENSGDLHKSPNGDRSLLLRKKEKISFREFLQRLKRARLQAMPGGAEILVDELTLSRLKKILASKMFIGPVHFIGSHFIILEAKGVPPVGIPLQRVPYSIPYSIRLSL